MGHPTRGHHNGNRMFDNPEGRGEHARVVPAGLGRNNYSRESKLDIVCNGELPHLTLYLFVWNTSFKNVTLLMWWLSRHSEVTDPNWQRSNLSGSWPVRSSGLVKLKAWFVVIGEHAESSTTNNIHTPKGGNPKVCVSHHSKHFGDHDRICRW